MLRENGRRFQTVTYINSSAAVKALSDWVVTSGNAEEIIRRVPSEEEILFVPDRHLGQYLEEVTGRKMILWNGSCMVHEIFSVGDLLALKRRLPNAVTIAHPECPANIREHSDFVGGTEAMIRYVGNFKAASDFLVATEANMMWQLQSKFPGHRYHPSPASLARATAVPTWLEIHWQRFAIVLRMVCRKSCGSQSLRRPGTFWSGAFYADWAGIASHVNHPAPFLFPCLLSMQICKNDAAPKPRGSCSTCRSRAGWRILPEWTGRRNFADVRIAWNESGLGVQAEVRGKQQAARGDESRPRGSDGLSLWIDTRDARTAHRASRYCHQFYLLPTGGGPDRDEPVCVQAKINRALQDAPTASANSVLVRAAHRRGGYLLKRLCRRRRCTAMIRSKIGVLGFTMSCGMQNWASKCCPLVRSFRIGKIRACGASWNWFRKRRLRGRSCGS